jgi:hypothetical protein
MTQIEITIRKVDSAPVFRDERVIMTDPAAGVVELQARATCDPYNRNARVFQSSGKLIESRFDAATQGN